MINKKHTPETEAPGPSAEYPATSEAVELPSPGVYTSEQLALRCGVSLKFVIKNRQRLPGAFRAGRVWRFDKMAVEKSIQVTGKLF